MQRWRALSDTSRVAPIFIQVGYAEVPVDGFMSFAVSPKAAALADLLRALELDAAIISGLDVMPVALQAAREIALPVFIAGSGKAEERVLAQWLPSRFVNPAERRHYVVSPDEALVRAALRAEAQRSSFAVKLRSRLYDRRDGSDGALAAFPAFMATAVSRTLRRSGFQLQTSGNIQRVPAHVYRMVFGSDTVLSGASVIVLSEFPDMVGHLAMEWTDPAGRCIARDAAPLAHLPALHEIAFRWPAMPVHAGENWELKFTVQQGNRPLRLLEWRRYQLHGWKVDRQPFILFTEST